MHLIEGDMKIGISHSYRNANLVEKLRRWLFPQLTENNT